MVCFVCNVIPYFCLLKFIDIKVSIKKINYGLNYNFYNTIVECLYEELYIDYLHRLTFNKLIIKLIY